MNNNAKNNKENKKNEEIIKNNKKIKKKPIWKIILYIILFLLIFKWIILYITGEEAQKTKNNIHLNKLILPNTIEYTINYKNLQPFVAKEYNSTKEYINKKIDEIINEQRRQSLNNLNNFYDDVFGYVESWKMVGEELLEKVKIKKTGELEKEITKKFENEVILKGMDSMNYKIANLIQNSLKDYYKSILIKTKEDINKKLKEIKKQKSVKINIDKKSIPFNKIIDENIAMVGTDILSEGKGKGLSIVLYGLSKISTTIAGKTIGAKLGGTVAAKIATVVGTKIETIVATKLFAASSFFIGVIIDLATNEAVKKYYIHKYNEEFQDIVNSIYDTIDKEWKIRANNYLTMLTEEINKELSKQTKIKVIMKGNK